MEGEVSVRDLPRTPVGKVRVSGVVMAFDCGLDEIKILSKIQVEIKNI